MSEELIVDFASPTLAGIKTGSLFSGECGGKEELSEFAARMNRRLTPHGLRLMPLRFNEKRALMYIYRPERLREDLDDPLAKEILGARIPAWERRTLHREAREKSARKQNFSARDRTFPRISVRGCQRLHLRRETEMHRHVESLRRHRLREVKI